MFDIKKAAEDMYGQMVEWRRDFHRHPELSNQEFRTSAIVADFLRSIGVDEIREHVGGTGVVALIKGTEPGKVVGFRADMDALAIQENTGFEYSSEVDGVMHACGHDANTAMLMATAKILSEHRDCFKGTVKLIFQPGEEGGHGAQHMVEDGVLENPTPDAIMGAHLMFDYAGEIGFRTGPSYFSSDEVKVELTGAGGHGAKPHETNDPLLAMCKLVVDLQVCVSRKISPLEGGVVTVGHIESGTRSNIIPESARMECTVRANNEETRQRLLKGIQDAVDAVCILFGTKSKLEIQKGCPPLITDAEVMKIMEDGTRKALGDKAIIIHQSGRSGSEDFPEFLSTGIPGGFIWVGGKYPGQEIPSTNHQPGYDWDETCMKAGCAAEVASIIEFLN